MGIIVNESARKEGLKMLVQIFLKLTGSCPISAGGIATCNLRGYTNVFLQLEPPAEVDITVGACTTLSVMKANKEVLAAFVVTTRYNPTGKHDILEFYSEINKNLDAMHPVASKIAEINTEFVTRANYFLYQNGKGVAA